MRRWSPCDKRTVGRLYGQGVPVDDIARRLGRSVYAVNNMLFKMRHEHDADRNMRELAEPRRWWSGKEEHVLRKEYEAGTGLSTIAGILGRSEAAVRGKVAQLRERGLLGYRAMPWTQDEVLRLKVLCSRSVPPDEVAWRLGRSVDAVRCKARELGV